MTDIIQVITTTADQNEANKIARALVEKRLAACAQVSGPITSCYWWEGKIETSTEWRCLIKTRRGLYPQVEQAIIELHPYEVPAILAVPVAEGSQSYLKWMDKEMKNKVKGKT